MTSFISTLSDDQLRIVRDRALEERPFYFNSAVADAKAVGGNIGDLEVETQLSEDAEAFIILLSRPVKASLIAWCSAVSVAATSPELIALFDEILTARQVTLKQVNTDIGTLTKTYTDVRPDLTPEVPITDIGQMLRAFNTAFQSLTTPQKTQIHHRIMDYLTVEMYKRVENGSFKKELNSWQQILTRYL